MSELGCEVGNNFSPKQLRAIQLFATGQYNCTQVAELIKVSNHTISVWRKNDQFLKAIQDEARKLLKDTLPEVYKALGNEAKKGKFPHIKILLEHLDSIDKITEAKDNVVTFGWDN